MGKDELLLQSRRRFDGKSGDDVSRGGGGEGLSNVNKAILLVIALVQIVLLIVLSFDPMTAGKLFMGLDEDRWL
jgi:hypothetical protein